MTRPALLVSALVAVLAAGVATAAADEAKTAMSASMILSIVSTPVNTRTSAYDAGLKEKAAPVPDSTSGEVLADGSVRYGRAIVTVRNPCPPGEHLDTPVVLPGRRGRCYRPIGFVREARQKPASSGPPCGVREYASVVPLLGASHLDPSQRPDRRRRSAQLERTVRLASRTRPERTGTR